MNFHGNGKRMPVWASQDKIRKHWLHGVCAVEALYAIFTWFGKAEGAAQILLRQTMPLWLWPLMLLASVALIEFGFSVQGGLAGAAVWGAFTACIVVTIFRGTALSDGGWILPFGMAWLNVLVIYDVGSGLDADREFRQRRA